jgi:hypothetical protein
MVAEAVSRLMGFDYDDAAVPAADDGRRGSDS